MKVIRSALTGYCHGVSETIRKANTCLRLAEKKNLNCYSIGQLIHNNDVSAHYEKQGLKIVNNPEEAEPGVALIRAHGIPQSLRRSFLEKGFILEDATCVNIKKTQSMIMEANRSGRTVVLLAVRSHAESLCLQGTEDPSQPGKPIPVFLVSSEEDLKNLFDTVDQACPITLVVQTTFEQGRYEKLSNMIMEHYPDCEKGNSLCYACLKRKKAAEDLCGLCQAVVVVGGLNSENTKDLAKYIQRQGCMVYCVENVSDMDSDFEEDVRKNRIETIGVCSGTSTPSEIIDAVCERLESLN